MGDFADGALGRVGHSAGVRGHTSRVVPALLHPRAAAFAGSVLVEVTDTAAKVFLRHVNFAKAEGSDKELVWRARASRALVALSEVVVGSRGSRGFLSPALAIGVLRFGR